MSHRYKIVLFSEQRSAYRALSFSKRRLLFYGSVITILGIACAWFSVDFLANIRHNSKIVILETQNNSLLSQLEQMSAKANRIEQSLTHIQKSNDELRVMANLDQIDADTRNVGRGGNEFEFNYTLTDLNSDLADQVKKNQLTLEKLEQQMRLETQSQQEIFDQFKYLENYVKYYPAIRPIPEGIGRLTASLGMRPDPFTGVRRPHKGIDISAPRGTPVYATADGSVVFANWNRGYGNMIALDHGNRLKTFYGHLSKMDVRVGMKVKRGQKIGEVGSTGRSTAPHLHYEVRDQNDPQNPLNYFYDDEDSF
jgi:murein DD-endopeptidase MepM/ murein hydrolase activator NlpD